MTKEERIKALLEKRYLEVIEQKFSTDSLWKGKEKQFDTNQQAIDQSLEASLAMHSKNLSKLDKHYKHLKEQVKTVLNEHLENLATEKSYQKQAHQDNQAQIEESLINKQELNKLKRQKVKATFDHAVKEATQFLTEQEKAADKKQEEAIKAHNNQMEELLADTNKKYEENNKIETEASKQFDNVHTKIETDKEKTITKIHQEKKAYLASLKDGLKALKEAFEKEKKPIDAEIADLKAEQKKELKSLEDAFKAQLAKLENYKKEAAKIGDTSNTHQYEKQMKQLKKKHNSDLKEKRIEHKEQLTPEEEKRTELIETYTKKFTDFKHNGVDRIASFLKQIETTKTEALIAIDEANTEFNLALAEHQYHKHAINIDYEIQNINYDQTLEENKLINEYTKRHNAPVRDKKENEARLQLNLEENELNKAEKVAEAKHKRDIERAQSCYAYEERTLELLGERLNHLYEYDIEHLKIMKNIHKAEQDKAEEKMLINHYLYHSKNYSALTTEHFKAYRPYFETEINNRLNHQIETYKIMLKAVEDNHKHIKKNINTIYEKEKAIYEIPLKQMKQSHDKILADLSDRQKRELNDLNRKLEVKTTAADKKQMEHLKRELKDIQELHEEEYHDKKRELERKRFVYNKMLATIEENKTQSIEEAETLLYHTTDQINLAIDEAKLQAKESIEEYESRIEEIMHRTNLFKTFQIQREKDTLGAAEDYKDARITRFKAKQTKNEALLKDQLVHLDNLQTKAKNEHRETLNDIEAVYERRLTEIEKDKEAAYNAHHETYQEEKDRLELYMDKLKKSHEEAMKKLKETNDTKKQNAFQDKERNEENLKKETERLNKSLLEEKDKKNNQLKKEHAFIDENATKLKKHIAADALKHLKAEALPTIETILTGAETINAVG